MKAPKIFSVVVTKAVEQLINNSVTGRLNLYGKGITDAGASAIAEAVKVNTSVTWLSLSCNQIGPAGAAALAWTDRSDPCTSLPGHLHFRLSLLSPSGWSGEAAELGLLRARRVARELLGAGLAAARHDAGQRPRYTSHRRAGNEPYEFVHQAFPQESREHRRARFKKHVAHAVIEEPVQGVPWLVPGHDPCACGGCLLYTSPSPRD